MILSDESLLHLIKDYNLIDNYQPEQIQPASIDLRLNETLTLKPKKFKLGSTHEYIKIPKEYVGRVEGKSSWGRLGLAVHITAGYIDPGFEGNITLEFYNFSNKTITIDKGTCICQLCVEKLDKAPLRVYGDENLKSHYQGQTGITESYIEGYIGKCKNCDDMDMIVDTYDSVCYYCKYTGRLINPETFNPPFNYCPDDDCVNIKVEVEK